VPQPLERFKDAVMILRIDSDAVIAHAEHPLGRFASAGYVYLRRSFIRVFDRIADQVLKYSHQQILIHYNRRQFIKCDLRAAFFNPQSELL
jgi:hypothetical protein